jgi:lysophospholipase L1-like esterase
MRLPAEAISDRGGCTNMQRVETPRVRKMGWALILMLPVVLLGGLEACVRVLDIRPAVEPTGAVPPWLDSNQLIKESRWIELLSARPRDLTNYYRTYRWDRDLLYALQPNVDLPLTDITAPPELRERTRWVFRTNARGFNTPDVPLEKPAGTFRVVAMGDSSTFGWGVESDQTYARVLESLLRARHPGRRLEVINLGICGYSSLQGRILMQLEGTLYRPDVVTISYGANDYSPATEPLEATLARQRGFTGRLRSWLHHSRAYQIYGAWLLSRVKPAPPGPRPAEGAAAPAPEAGPAILNVGPEKSRENLEAMGVLARRSGIDAVFVTNCLVEKMAPSIEAAAAASGWPLLDSVAAFDRALPEVLAGRRYADLMARYRGLYPASYLESYPWLAVYLTDLCHPNVIGQRIIAEELVPLIEATPAFRRWTASPQ